jgi:hypothetical protein
VQPGGGGRRPHIEIVLVGWHPPLLDAPPGEQRLLWTQFQITHRSPAAAIDSSSAVRLVSLNYGKTIGWSGRGPMPQEAANWLARLDAAKGEGPDRLSRVYNVPVDTAVYRLLLGAGVDLLGVRNLIASRQVLVGTSGVSPQ